MGKYIKILLSFILTFALVSCGSGEEGDASKYTINETNIKYVTVPSQEYIVSILESISVVDSVEAVTEENDPNKILNKEGGYYSAVYFKSNMVENDENTSPIDAGTDGGGCVECYRTEEDAIQRDKYLGKFKSSGGHVRLGTIIIRTSSLLDDENRSKLEEIVCNTLLSGKIEKKEEAVAEKSDNIENNTEGTTIPADTEDEKTVFADDAVVNRFITEFNNMYDDDITNISQGNTRTRYFGYIRNTRIEMNNATDAAADAFRISVYGGQEESDRNEMFDAFREIIKVLEPSLNADDVENAINELISNDVMTENDPLGNTLYIDYVPIKKVSYGKTDCRIDIDALEYKDTSENTDDENELIEMNSLQQLFFSLTNETTRDEIDSYISDNDLLKYAFYQDSGYYIGYEKSAIRTRGRDREGEAVDISFDKNGMVRSAEYAFHTGFTTHTPLRFENDVFYFNNYPCKDAETAYKRYLKSQDK